jgi:hypothetical protein
LWSLVRRDRRLIAEEEEEEEERDPDEQKSDSGQPVQFDQALDMDRDGALDGDGDKATGDSFPS